MSRTLALLLLGGCFSPSPPAGTPCPNGVCPSGLVCSPATMTCEKESSDIDARPIDAAPDALPNGCYGDAEFLVVCPTQNITGQDIIQISTSQTVSTSVGSNICEPYTVSGMASTDYCLVAAKSISILAGRTWAFTGTRPLILLATSSITIGGSLDVASHRGGSTGPGADPSACIPGGTKTLDDGGPGGSFGSVGGSGGGTDLGPAVPAGPTAALIDKLRGGCSGQPGNGGNAGAAGRGGGAVYLISDSIQVTGVINASGGSGVGAGLSAGGGGGGSGGMIVLAAPMLTTVGGEIFANGGGGGEGGGGSNGGNDGTDSVAPTTISTAGRGNAGGGGDGGDGAIGGVAAKSGANGVDSGGGGGGGVGVIRVFPSQTLQGSISPPPT